MRTSGLTPKKYQSGQTDVTGRISKVGDASVREALYQAAHVMLTKPVKNCTTLKSWAMRIASRAGMRKAKVALARKLAVILHRMLADDNRSTPRPGPPPGCCIRRSINRAFGRATTPGPPKAKSLRRDEDPVRPPSGKSAHNHASVDWPAGSSNALHQVTASAPIPYRSKCPARG